VPLAFALLLVFVFLWLGRPHVPSSLALVTPATRDALSFPADRAIVSGRNLRTFRLRWRFCLDSLFLVKISVCLGGLTDVPLAAFIWFFICV
jgi:hypothetical protein